MKVSESNNPDALTRYPYRVATYDEDDDFRDDDFSEPEIDVLDLLKSG